MNALVKMFRLDGVLEVWDLLYSHGSPVLTAKVRHMYKYNKILFIFGRAYFISPHVHFFEFPTIFV